ncbi:MAG: glycosyltransferase [Acidobacteria bacterium]|nr:glycosyltransferase [Acidobacteriota bacterium]
MITAGLAAGYLTLLLVKMWLAVRAARHTRRRADRDLSDVAVVQPILSGDPSLGDVLEDNVVTLPSAQFVWVVDSGDGPARDLCDMLRRRHAKTRFDILVLPPAGAGENPKLFKLERVRTAVGDRVLLVLDDDTRMPAESLACMIDGLDGSELVTALPAYIDDGRWPSRLLAQFVNNNAALTYLPLLHIAPPVTINGMAYAIRAGTLDRLGGFGPIMGCITDDLAVAHMVIASGGSICQTAAPVWVTTTVTGGRHYMRQMHRWFVFALLQLRCLPAWLKSLTVLLHAAPPLLLWGVAAAVALRPTRAGLVAVAVLLAVRSAGLIGLQRRVYGRSLHHPVSSVVSELLLPVHMVHALVQRTITWRTRRYRVQGDRTFRAVP